MPVIASPPPLVDDVVRTAEQVRRDLAAAAADGRAGLARLLDEAAIEAADVARSARDLAVKLAYASIGAALVARSEVIAYAERLR